MMLLIRPLDCAEDDPNVVLIEETEAPEAARIGARRVLASRVAGAPLRRRLRLVALRR